MQLGARLRDRLFPRRHTALLVAIVATISVRPLIGDTGVAAVLFSIALLAILLVALYNVRADDLVGERAALLAERRRRHRIGWTLAALAIGERVATAVAPDPRLVFVATLSWLLLFCFVIWVELRAVLRQKQVTGETISMAISVFLLLGLAWGLAYGAIYQLDPASFDLGRSSLSSSELSGDPQRIFATFVYFSLTALTTIGFGDITPLTDLTRYAAVAEGMVGQFYLAILVARLVALQMSGPADRDVGGSG